MNTEDKLAPQWAIEVNGADIGQDISRFISEVSYESADGMADMARLRCVNPDSYLSNMKVFQPGNELSIYGGYGSGNLIHIGRVIIVRMVPNYPESGQPTMEVTGYTKDSTMMDNSPEKAKKRLHKNQKYFEAVADKINDERYQFYGDVDNTPHAPKDFIQKSGMSDYDFIKGLANITGYYFWVDGQAGSNKNSNWTLHFKNPELYVAQEKIYTFKYDYGDQGTLLSFKPEFLIKGATTKIAVVSRDHYTGKVIKTELEEENQNSPEMDASGDLNGNINKEISSGSSVKLYFQDYAFDVFTEKKFKKEADLIAWAQQWFRRYKENFVLAKGRTIGVETLMARQTHKIDGVGIGENGEYFFSKVKHSFGTSGYVCDFAGRKITE